MEHAEKVLTGSDQDDWVLEKAGRHPSPPVMVPRCSKGWGPPQSLVFDGEGKPQLVLWLRILPAPGWWFSPAEIHKPVDSWGINNLSAGFCLNLFCSEHYHGLLQLSLILFCWVWMHVLQKNNQLLLMKKVLIYPGNISCRYTSSNYLCNLQPHE